MNGTNPTELADAMRKMEECLQVFAQLSGGQAPGVTGQAAVPSQAKNTNPAQLRNNCLSPNAQQR